MEKLYLIIHIFTIVMSIFLGIIIDYKRLKHDKKLWLLIPAFFIGAYFYIYKNWTIETQSIKKCVGNSVVLLTIIFMLVFFSRREWIREKFFRGKRISYALCLIALEVVLFCIEQILFVLEICFPIGCFFAIIAFEWIVFEQKKNDKFSDKIIVFLQAVMVFVLLNASNNCIGGIAVLGIIPIVLFLYGIYCIGLRKFKLPMYLVVSVIGLLGVANSFVVLFRGTPFLADDFYSIKTAMNVADSYSYSLEITTLLVLFVFVLLVLSVKKMLVKTNNALKENCITVLCAIICLVLCWFGPWYQNVVVNTSSPQLVVRENGYFSTMIANIKAGIIKTPSDYSVEAIEQLAEEFEETFAENTTETNMENNEEAKKPNIIVIMNEAFCDLSVVGGFETTEEYMPFINSLSGNNVVKNWLITRNGSGTSISESEFLLSTVNSNYYESLPWVRNIKSDIPSIVSVLKEQGYYAVGMHPEARQNYNRWAVWSYLGFDEKYFEENMNMNSFDSFERVNENISDAANYEKLISVYENRDKDKPFFAFNITMQNHSPYTDEEKIDITSFDSVDDVERYLAYIKESDAAFEMLINYFENQDEETIILMFGDHQPSLDISFWETVIGKSQSEFDEEEQLKTITVPYIMWANYDVEIKDIGRISANYLAPYLLETAGLQMSSFQRYVWKQYEKTPVIYDGGYIDSDGNFYKYEDETEYSEWLNNYSLITYNYIFDSQNRVESFFGRMKN